MIPASFATLRIAKRSPSIAASRSSGSAIAFKFSMCFLRIARRVLPPTARPPSSTIAGPVDPVIVESAYWRKSYVPRSARMALAFDSASLIVLGCNSPGYSGFTSIVLPFQVCDVRIPSSGNSS